MRLAWRVLVAYVAVAGFITVALFTSLNVANHCGLRAEKRRFEASHFSLDPATYALPADSISAETTLSDLKARLNFSEEERAALKLLTRTDPMTWTASDRVLLAGFEERAAPVIEELTSLVAQPALDLGSDPEEWVQGTSPVADHTVAVSLSHLILLRALSLCRSCPPPDPAADTQLLLDFALHLYRQPLVIDDVTGMALERQSLRILKRDFDSFGVESLQAILGKLETLSSLPGATDQIAPQLAATSRWGFKGVGAPWLGVTSEGATALWLRCQARALNLVRLDFATAAREVDAIEASSPLSPQLICRRFIRGQFEALLRYEVERYPRDLARSAIRLRLRQLEAPATARPRANADCVVVRTTPSSWLPEPLDCTISRPDCLTLSAVVPDSALEMMFDSVETRDRFEALLRWEVCAPATPLLSSPAS